jgi:hypothetical protein
LNATTATIAPLGGQSTFTLYDRDIEVAAGSELTIASGVTLRGEPTQVRLVRPTTANASVVIETGTLLENITVAPINGGSATIDGATFQVSAGAVGRNYVSIGHNSTLTLQNSTMIGNSARNIGGLHLWGDNSLSTVTNLDGSDLSYGVLMERLATATITGGVWENYTRFTDMRRNADLIFDGVTIIDNDPALTSTVIWTETNETGLSLDYRNLDIQIQSGDIAGNFAFQAFLDGHTFTTTNNNWNLELGQGFYLRPGFISSGTYVFGFFESDHQTEWLVTGDFDFRNTVSATLVPGTAFRNSSGTFRNFYMRDTTQLAADGVSLRNMRVSFFENSFGTVQNSTLEFDFASFTQYTTLRIDSPGVISALNNTIRAVDAAVGQQVGISVTGTSGVAPTISNNTVESFGVCIQNAVDPQPVITGTTYVNCLTDFLQD